MKRILIFLVLAFSFTVNAQSFEDYKASFDTQINYINSLGVSLDSNNRVDTKQQEQIDFITKQLSSYDKLLTSYVELEARIKTLEAIVKELSNGDVTEDPKDDDEVIITPPSTKGLAFPTAKGAGAYVTGGRGGKVIRVTTLDWSAKGGLKEALHTKGKRIIVFDVSGTIDATSEYEYSYIIKGSDYDNITIAGQTAPEGGISILTSEFMLQDVSNIIIRNVRFRGTSWTRDTFWLHGGKDIILDHCSFSFGGDESASLAASSGRTQDPEITMENITVQNCFFQDSKTGMILGTEYKSGNFTFVNNVFSNISHRFPNPKGNGHYDIINNVVYNWKYRLVRITGSGTYNVVNNYYKPSKKGLRLKGWFGDYPITFLNKLQTKDAYTPLIYASGSIITGQRDTPQKDDSDTWQIFDGSNLPTNSEVPSKYFTDTMFDLVGEPYTILSAQDTYNSILSDVGAYKTLNADGSINIYRDNKDSADYKMILNDTYNGTFYNNDVRVYPTVLSNKRPDNYDSNNDGIPNEYAKLRGFDINTDLSGYVWESGNVGIDEYLSLIDK